MVLCYHGVRAGFEAGISSIPASRLQAQLDYLGARGHDVAVTLDDAFTSQVELWSRTLSSRGFQATLFVPAAYVGAPAGWDYTSRRRHHASWSQLTDWCHAGHTIGSHGMHHRDLRALGDSELKVETADSRKLLEDRLGVEVKHFSYPFGRFTEKIIEHVQQAGYTRAFTTQPRGGEDSAFTQPRVVVSYLDTALSVEARALGSAWGHIERGKQRIITFWSGGTSLRQTWFHRMEKAAA